MKFGLLGRSLSHSFSAAYFKAKFSRESKTNFSYQNFELASIAGLPALLQQHTGLAGFNVTIPYKEAILPYLQHSSDVVKEVGACNCVKLTDGELHGFNTDVTGFKKTLLPLLKAHHQKALILGTGGAAKAVGYVLDSLKIPYQFVSRSAAANAIRYEEITEKLLFAHHIIINTTPVGTAPETDAAPPIPYHLLMPYHFLYDLIYNPEKTSFLQRGEDQGCQIENGYQMLVEQAEASWRIWMEEETQ